MILKELSKLRGGCLHGSNTSQMQLVSIKLAVSCRRALPTSHPMPKHTDLEALDRGATAQSMANTPQGSKVAFANGRQAMEEKIIEMPLSI